MFSFEEKIINTIEKNKEKIFLFIIFMLGLYVRYINVNFETPDYQKCLLPWFHELGKNAGGFSSLKYQVGNYNITYQFLICIMTYLPFKPIFSYKLLSVIFDVLLAIEAYRIVKFITNDSVKASIAFTVIYICPTVIMNSAIWAQCDSIYAYFVVLSLRKLLEEKYLYAFIFFGIAFAFKLQAIFFLPFLFYVYISERKFSAVYFVYAFIAFYVMNIPGFLAGRSLFDPISNYLFQTAQYESMRMNVINFWSICPGTYVEFIFIAIVMTLSILGSVLLMIMNNKNSIKNNYLELAAWCMWTCTIFLPSMHDRYAFPAEMILLILCVLNKKFIIPTMFQLLCSIQSYCWYLFDTTIEFEFFLALFQLISWIYFSYSIFTGTRNKHNSDHKDKDVIIHI